MSRIRANQITNQSADGAPTVQNGLVISGVTTSTTFSGSGASLTNIPSAQLTGALPALDGSNLTGITQTTINNNANNRIITGSGTANTLEGEANLTYDGTDLTVTGSNTKIIVDSRGSNGDQAHIQLLAKDGSGTNNFGELEYDGDGDFSIASRGSGSANNSIVFKTTSSNVERLRIESGGTLFSKSPSDATPNFKFISDDTNWHGYLNQTVHGATISTILSCGGTWTVDGTTYNATKDYNGSFGTAALIVHNQYNSTATGGELVFVTKANGSSTTDGAVTERLRITSTGQVGINQSNPARALTINALGTGTSSRIVRLATQDNNTRFDFSFENANNLTIQNGSSDAAIVKLHTSGYVTKPSQPSFAAYRAQDSFTQSGVIVFNATRHNIGSHYNTSNGRFTAPVAGRYQFNFYSIILGSYNSAYYSIRINGTAGKGMHVHVSKNVTGWDNVCTTWILNLNASDYVDINSNSSINWHGNDWQLFSGELLS